jgi:hypothetical protein
MDLREIADKVVEDQMDCGAHIVYRKGSRFIATTDKGWCLGLIFRGSGAYDFCVSLINDQHQMIDGAGCMFTDGANYGDDNRFYDMSRCFYPRSGELVCIMRHMLANPRGWMDGTIAFLPGAIEELT